MEEPTETSPTALQVDGGRVAPAAGEMVRELFAAIRAKNKDRVRELLEMGADVNAYEPSDDIIFGLIIIGIPFSLLCIPLNDTNAYKKTPLHVAVTTGDPDMVVLLLEFGADRNAPATFVNCCCCKKTPMQFVDMQTGADHLGRTLPAEQRAPIKELLIGPAQLVKRRS